MLPHLRPLDAGEILDGAFTRHRRHLRALPAAGAGPLSPLAAARARTACRAGRGVRREALHLRACTGRPATGA